MDVDTALSEVPVNMLPLLDDTTFKDIEAAVAYNAAGMALYWHFVTPAGAYTVTAVTPTTGGNYDWTDQGDAGIYTIEIPASGGASINNDTEGFGWFTGKATGVLPWRGPVIGFRRAALNDLMIEGGTASTNLEDFFDGTGYVGGTIKLATDATLNATQGSYAPAKAGDAMTLADDAITASKFDESTAFPLKSADASTTILARVGDKMDIVDAPSVTGTGVIVSAIWDKLLTGITTTGSVGKLIKDYLDAAISTRSSHSAADVWSSATRSLTEKTGFSLSQTFPTNFSSMVISALGKVTVGTNDDKTGYTASVSDKTGFSLSTAGILEIWHQLLTSIATAGSIGKLIKDNLDAKVSEAGGGSLTAADIADAVLDEAAAGHTGVIATNLDAAVSTRSTYAGGAVASVTAGVTVTTNNDKTGYSLSVTPPTASQIDTQLSGTHGAGAWGAGATGSSTYTDTITDGSNPLEDVQVELYSSSDYSGTPVAVEETDVNGVFTFSLNPGTYYVRCIKSGYTFTDFSKVVT